jgi:hypothetical protein
MSYTKKEVYNDLKSLGYFSKTTNPYLDKLVQCLPTYIPYKMRMSIAVSELVLFTSMFRRNINFNAVTEVPVNAITFVLANSGVSKDRSVKTLRGAFKLGYKVIDDFRNSDERDRVLRSLNGGIYPDIDDIPALELSSKFGKEYRKPPEIFCALSTHEGFISHLNTLEEGKLGAGYIYSGEIGSELQSNSLVAEIFKLLSEVYDLGQKELKMIKDTQNRNKSIKNLPVSALFISDPNLILFDVSIKRKFFTEFVSKLSRRVFFCFTPLTNQQLSYESKEKYLEEFNKEESDNIKNIQDLQKEFESISNKIIATNYRRGIALSKEVDEDYKLYMLHNKYEAQEINRQLYPMTKISIEHSMWRALKLAGAIAIISNSRVIDRKHFIEAVSYCETIKEDIKIFEQYANKTIPEQLFEYCSMIAVNNTAEIALHDLVKMGYIKNTSNIEVNSLLEQLNQINSDYVFTIEGKKLKFQKITKNDVYKVSGKTVKGISKADRIRNCSSDLKEATLSNFKTLGKLLSQDYGFSPFSFEGGIRSNETCRGSTNWIVLDIDDGILDIEEAHNTLSEYNHHIALTSNPSKLNNYRVILELDRDLDISSDKWKKFLILLDEELNLGFDKLPKVQIFFGYAGRQVTSVINKTGVDLTNIVYKLSDITIPRAKKLTEKEKADIGESLHEIFWYAFTEKAMPGKKRVLYKVTRHAKDLGFNESQTREILDNIINYWAEDLDEIWFRDFSKQLTGIFND